MTATRDSLGALRAAVNWLSDGIEGEQAAELLRQTKPPEPELATRMERVAALSEKGDAVGAVAIAMNTLRQFEEAA